MNEQKLKKQKEKEEQERYDAKIEAEIANYNPWGKGGAGAPMRDQTGNVVGKWSFLYYVALFNLMPTITPGVRVELVHL